MRAIDRNEQRRRWARTAVASAIGVALATGAPAVAGAQSASGTQYGTGSSVTDPSLVAGANENAGTSTTGSDDSSSGSGSDTGSSSGTGTGAGSGGNGTAGTGTAATGAGAAGGATSGVSPADANRISVLTLGTAQRDLADDVQEALAAAGLRTLTLDASSARVKAFLAGPLAKQASGGGAQAVGQAVGAQLATSTDLAGRIFTSLFGSGQAPQAVTRAILSRPENPNAALDAFTKGLARGFAAAGITVVWVERSDTKDSLVSEYGKIPGVGTVGDVDTPAGKKRLADLITGGGTGRIGVSAAPVAVDGKQVSATTPGGGSNDGLLYGLVGVTVLGAGAFAGTGVARRRRQG